MTIVIGVGVVVEEDGKVLLGKRSSGNWSGSWSLPGGKIEQFEDIITCAARELHEETGLSPTGELEITSISTDICPADDFHTVTFGVTLRQFRGDLINKEADKFSEWRWTPFNELPSELFPPSISVLSAYLAARGEKLNIRPIRLDAASSREVFVIDRKVQ